MGWLSLFLEKTMSLIVGKKNLIPKSIIETDFKKIVRLHRLYSIKTIVQNNFDLKPTILKLFFWTYWIDGVFFVCSAVANSFYTSLFFYLFFGIKISGIDKTDINLNWIGTFIINLLIILFLIRWISDYYKLSLRDKYRSNYLKLLWLDIITLNFLNIIGTLIFIKNKKQVANLNGNSQEIKQGNLNSQAIKNYSKTITRIEILILLFNLILFGTTIIIGYFVSINSIKIICLTIMWITIGFMQCWSLPKIVGLIIVRKMLNNLLNNGNYYFLLTIIRFLGFTFCAYYIVVFLNILKFDENYKEFIMKEW